MAGWKLESEAQPRGFLHLGRKKMEDVNEVLVILCENVGTVEHVALDLPTSLIGFSCREPRGFVLSVLQEESKASRPRIVCFLTLVNDAILWNFSSNAWRSATALQIAYHFK